MSLGSILAGLVKPLTDVLDDQTLSKEERAEKVNELNVAAMAALETHSAVLVADARGGGFIQRSWRPLLALSFGGILAGYWLSNLLGIWFVWFGWPAMFAPVPSDLERIAMLFLGVYGGSRGLEKIAATLGPNRKR